MAAQPMISYKSPDYFRTGLYVMKSIQTYALVKKRMKEMLEESYDNEVNVTRERRGEWGQWFERWSLINGKPKIIKQTWL